MSEQVEMPARQAGAIYLKNTVSNYWEPVKLDETPTTPVEALSEQDKQTIRDNLIEAVIHSPDPIRNQLVICVRQIAQADFPDKWTAIIEKVHHFIQTNDMNQWYGSLQAFYQLCKVFEYELISVMFIYLFSSLYILNSLSLSWRFKQAKDREPYHKAMRIMLPMFLERLCQLNEDQSDLSVLTQKQILKIFFTFIQVSQTNINLLYSDIILIELYL